MAVATAKTKAAKPAKPKVSAPTEPTPPKQVFDIPADRCGDPDAYALAYRDVLAARGRGEVKAIDAQRDMQVLAQACLECTGMSLEEASRNRQDPIRRFQSLIESGEAELVALEAAVKDIDEKEVPDGKKKSWLNLIARTRALQAECREHPAKFWTYVARDDRPKKTRNKAAASVLKMEPFHLQMFRVWNDPEAPNSLIMAPPGHGKSTNLRGQILYEIGHHPELRCLYITDEVRKAQKTIQVLHRTLISPRYRALFPGIRVLGRGDNAESSSRAITVARDNWISREPTIEAAAIESRIQGNRYDRIYGDDFCSPEVRYYPSIRQKTTDNWHAVVETRIANPETARIRIICTPWHKDDTPNRIARDSDEGRLDGWRIEIDPFRINDDAKGKAIPLWAVFSTAYLENQKVVLGADYNYVYRLRPANEEDKIIRRAYWYNAIPDRTANSNDRKIIEILAGKAERWLSIDPAGTAGVASSNTGCVDISMTVNGYVFVTDCWFYHVPIGGVIEMIRDRIIDAGLEPGYYGVHWEAQGGVKVGMPTVIAEVQRQLSERGYDPRRLQWLTTGTMVGGAIQHRSKIIRLKNCAGFIDNGLVRFAGMRLRNSKTGETYTGPLRASNMERLVKHIMEFDGIHNTDCVDALTQWLLYNRGRIHSLDAPAQREAPVEAKPTDRFAAMLYDQIEKMEKDELDAESAYGQESAFYGGMFGRVA